MRKTHLQANDPIHRYLKQKNPLKKQKNTFSLEKIKENSFSYPKPRCSPFVMPQEIKAIELLASKSGKSN